MKASIRDLKTKLSEHIRTAAAGEDVTVSVHGKTVVKIIAASKTRNLKDLTTEPGISWNGGKPTGMARPTRLRGGKTLAAMVVEDRR